MWTKILENAKLIISTILTAAALIAGTWTLVTSTFITHAQADILIKKYDIEISYNKAFRIETRIRDLINSAHGRELSESEQKELDRLIDNLKRVDKHIKSYNAIHSIGED